MFPNSLNLYIFGLQAMEILNRFMLYFVLLNFLCNHFVTVSEPKINLNFHKYNTITRMISSSNMVTFYAYYFGNYITQNMGCASYQNRSKSTSCEKNF